jgi:hypothetical protein
LLKPLSRAHATSILRRSRRKYALYNERFAE